MTKSLVKVVIPVYRDYFGELEEKSFLRCLKILGDYDIVIVQPENLDTTHLTNHSDTITVEKFPEKYFKTIAGYNELLLMSSFYERFLNSEYILIYQLDAFVFRNELQAWCQKGYDYIGAPWIATPQNTLFKKQFNKIARLFRSEKKNKRETIFYKVGNGGFSLRKVQSHYRIATEKKDFITEFLNTEKKELYSTEDVFWSIKAPEFDNNFKIPEYMEALHFAIDRKPKIAFKLVNNEMPFGCHGITKPKVVNFWKPILDSY